MSLYRPGFVARPISSRAAGMRLIGDSGALAHSAAALFFAGGDRRRVQQAVTKRDARRAESRATNRCRLAIGQRVPLVSARDDGLGKVRRVHADDIRRIVVCAMYCCEQVVLARPATATQQCVWTIHGRLAEQTCSRRTRGLRTPEKRGSGLPSQERRAAPFRPPRAVAGLRRVFRERPGLLRTRFLRESLSSTNRQ